MTRDDDEQFASWLAVGPHGGPEGGLEQALSRAHAVRQRPAWLVAMTGGTIGAERDSGVLRAMTLAVAAVALVGLLLGALVAGGVLPPPVLPLPSELANQSAQPSASEPLPTAEPTPINTPEPPQGLVAYQVAEQLEDGQGDCRNDLPVHWCQVVRIWISRTDGSDAHALHPDAPNGEQLIGWTPDGRYVVYLGRRGGLVFADPNGEVQARWSFADLCAGGPCPGLEGFAFSPDGTRLAYVITAGDQADSTVVAVLDLTSGEVTLLESTRTTNPAMNLCHARPDCQGVNDMPRWSPDGSRLAFARQVMSPEESSTWTSAAIYVVDADGGNLQRVTPTGRYAIDVHWSPDGSRLLFINVEQILSADRQSVESERADIYTARPDGSDLFRLTDDGTSANPHWTANGQVTFARHTVSGDTEISENWIMNADGSNATQLPRVIDALSAVGCESCLYPFPDSGQTWAYWQPTP